MDSFAVVEEKQRRISRILTIDEIINPGVHHNKGIPAATSEVETVNHGTSHFLRINQNRVIYSPGPLSPIPERVRRDGSKNVSFANNPTNPQARVYREQYWNWSLSCKTWSKRERTLLVAVGILGCIILGLVAFISVFARDHTLSPPLSNSWLGLAF